MFAAGCEEARLMRRYAVIMAGGSGTRLWPMSREHLPKQLLALSPDGKSLLEKSIERLKGLFDPGDIYIISTRAHVKPIAERLAFLPKENLIGEPMGRDTANAIGLAASIIYNRDPDATMGVFTADHIIEPIDRFQGAVLTGYDIVEQNPEYLCTFGIKPKYPHTGLGYIHRAEIIKDGEFPVYRVGAFKEKPDQMTAERYVQSGEYYWNSGMFVWKVRSILDELTRHLPASADKLIKLGKEYGKDNWDTLADSIYPELEKISIDYAVMEKAEKVLVVEMPVNWADVGSWSELGKVIGKDSYGNAKLVDKFVGIDVREGIFVSAEREHLIAAIGVEDLIVVHTKDATLISRRDRAQDVKKIVEIIKEKFGKEYV